MNTVLFPVPSVSAVYHTVATRHGAGIDINEIRLRMKAAYERQEIIDQHNDWKTSEEREFDRWRTIVAESMPEVDGQMPFTELWQWFATPQAWKVPESIATTLLELSGRGLIIGLGSNFDARLGPIVQQMDALAPIDDRVWISSLIGWRKPARGFFDQISQDLQLSPAEILFIGDDHRNDYLGALSAGMQAIHWKPGA